MKIVKKFEDLQPDWKEVMIKQTESACSFNKIYTSVNLTRRYHENLLAENEEYRDHFEICKDLVQDKWVTIGKDLIFDRNASAATFGLIMRNMFNWDKEETKKQSPNTQHVIPDDDELEKFKKKSQAQSELKVINQ